MHHLRKWVNKLFIYEKQFATVTAQKNIQNYYNEKCTYNIHTHCSLLYVLKVWNCSQQIFVGLEDAFKTSSRHVLKTSSTRLQRNNFTSSKTSWGRLEDLLQDVLKTSSCSMAIHLSQLSSCWICHLTFSWVQFLVI